MVVLISCRTKYCNDIECVQKYPGMMGQYNSTVSPAGGPLLKELFRSPNVCQQIQVTTYFWSMSMKLKSILFFVQKSDLPILISRIDVCMASSGVQIRNKPYSRFSLSGNVISRRRPVHLNGCEWKELIMISNAKLYVVHIIELDNSLVVFAHTTCHNIV